MAYLLIIMAAFLWGIIGLFVQKLYEFGFTAFEIVTIRVVSAALILFIFVLVKNRSLLKISWLDTKYFVGTGICSIVFFNWCFFTAIRETSLSIAAILLYTGPAFVTMISFFIFKERMTTRKMFALAITFLGCALVIGLFPASETSISFYGLLIGLGSGLGYALYSIFGKFALVKYESLTITTYTFIVASVFMLFFTNTAQLQRAFFNLDIVGYSLGLGFFPTALAYILYTIGLSRVESSRASITTTLEPVVASLIGVLFYGDVLSSWQILGVALVLLAVVSVQEKTEISYQNSMDSRVF